MHIDLKILHLRRALRYTAAKRPASIEEATLGELAARCGECLLVFDETGLPKMTDDGPALLGTPLPNAAYRVAEDTKAEEPEVFALAPGDYVFFQWRARNSSGGAPIGHASATPLFQIFEEVLREAWWQGIECSGPWFLRLVPEDGRLALQILRRARD